MNPKEFGWSDDQQVTVTNPTNKNFTFKVHGKEYEMPANESAIMPGYIAWVYVYKLATQLCLAEGKFLHWNEEGFRKQYYDRIVKSKSPAIQSILPEAKIEAVATGVADGEAEPTDTSKRPRR